MILGFSAVIVYFLLFLTQILAINNFHLKNFSISIANSSYLQIQDISSIWANTLGQFYITDRISNQIFQSISIANSTLIVQPYADTLSFIDLIDIYEDTNEFLYIIDDKTIFQLPDDSSSILKLGNSTESNNFMKATSILMDVPQSVVADTLGNIYFNMQSSSQILKVDLDSGLATVAIGSEDIGNSGDGGPALAARLTTVNSISLSSLGDIYVADVGNFVVRKVSGSTNLISTFAGNGIEGYSGDNGLATLASFSNLFSVITDTIGFVYIADTNNQRVRRVNITTNIITTFIGIGVAGYTNDGGYSWTAKVTNPQYMYIDTSCFMYLVDSTNLKIRKINLITGIISLFYTSLNPSIVPLGISGDSRGNIYLTDQHNLKIYRINPSTGKNTTVAGTGLIGYSGDGYVAGLTSLVNPKYITVDNNDNLIFSDGNAVRFIDHTNLMVKTVAGSEASSNEYSFNYGSYYYDLNSYSPSRMTIDTIGNIYFTSNNQIFKISSLGRVSLYAGQSDSGYSGDGQRASDAYLNSPNGIKVMRNGDIFIADTGNSVIRKIEASSNIITTVVGTGTAGYNGDGGFATAANLNNPLDLFVDTNKRIYIADTENNRIRFVGTNGNISTIAGYTYSGYNGDNIAATSAFIDHPSGIFVDTTGVVYFSDTNNAIIRKIDLTGIIKITVGLPLTFGYDGDGRSASNAMLEKPTSIHYNTKGDLYFVDSGNLVIRKVDKSTNYISTFAGSGEYNIYKNTYGDNKAATSAPLRFPSCVVGDTSTSIYIADKSNYKIKKVSISTNIISSVAYKSYLLPKQLLFSPTQLWVDTNSNIYVTDTILHSIVQIDAEDTFTLFAGNMSCGSGGDGGYASECALCNPSSVAFDSLSGNVYIADTFNNKIRLINSGNIVSTIAGNNTAGYTGDGGLGVDAFLYHPTNIIYDSRNKTLFISDSGNNAIRALNITSNFIKTIIAASSYSSINGALVLYADFNNSLYIADEDSFYTASEGQSEKKKKHKKKVNRKVLIAVIIPVGIIFLLIIWHDWVPECKYEKVEKKEDRPIPQPLPIVTKSLSMSRDSRDSYHSSVSGGLVPETYESRV